MAAPKLEPSMNPSPNAVSSMITASGPRTFSTVAAATVAGCSVRTPSTPSPTSDAYSRARARALPMPFDDGSSAACSARVFHMSS